MRYHCLGINKNAYGIGYAILDELAHTVEFSSNWIISVRDRGEDVGNLRVVGWIVEFTNGSSDRYGLWENEVLKRHALIVVSKYTDKGRTVGFKVYSTAKGILQLSETELIGYGKKIGIANAKIVEKKDGTTYIASLSGEFETEEMKKIAVREGQKLTAVEFVELMRRRGCTVDARGGVIEVSGDVKEIVFERLYVPEFGKQTVITFEMPIKVKNMTMVGNNTLFVGFNGSYIENLILDGRVEMHDIKIEHTPVLRVITKGEVQRISSVQIVRGFKEFIGGEKLNDIMECLDADYLELVDLRACTGAGSITRSFSGVNRKSEKAVGIWLGKFVGFNKVLEDCSVRFMSFFHADTWCIDGFSQVVGMKKLDLGSYEKMRVLGGMGDSEFEEVILPQKSENREIVLRKFLRAMKMKFIDIPDIEDCIYRIQFESLSNVEVIRTGGNVVFQMSTEMNTKRFIIKKKGVTVHLPYFWSGIAVSAEIEEGTEIVAVKSAASSWYKDIKFPKSLKEIQSGAFDSSRIWNMNLEETGLEKVGENAFKNVEFKGELIVLPETVTEIGGSAFNSEHIEKMYVPKSVSSIGRLFFKGDILYTVKGCLVDKTRKGSYVKIYVDGIEGLRELLSAKNSTDRELAKVTMAVGGKGQYGWLKEEKYRENAKFLLQIEKELEREEIVDRGITLDTSKYIDFRLEKLGLLGIEIRNVINGSIVGVEGPENKGVTDRFKVLSNMITRNTKFYAGHFTTEALKRFGETQEEVESYMAHDLPRYLYSDRDASILVMNMRTKGKSEFIRETLAVVIIMGGSIKYTTLIRMEDNFIWSNEQVKMKGARVEDYLTNGDKIGRTIADTLTLEMVEMPNHIASGVREWMAENFIEFMKSEKKTYISKNSGNVYRMKNYEGGALLTQIIKPEKHRFELGKELQIMQEGCFRYFDLINGVVKTEKRVMKSKKTEIAVICEKLAGEYSRAYGNELVEMILESIDMVVVNVPVKKLRRASMQKSMGDYAVIELNSQEAIKKLGYSRNFGITYIIAKKTSDWYRESGTAEGFLVAHNIAEMVNRKNLLKLDSSLPKPKFMKQYHVEDMYSVFINPCLVSKNIEVMISKHDGNPYLMISGVYKPGNGHEGSTFINLGELRDEIEALKMISEGLGRDLFTNRRELDKYGLTLADEARRGLIPVGEHPEYTINHHKIFEVLGL